MEKKVNARIPSSLFMKSDLLAKKIEQTTEERINETLSVRSISINGKTGVPIGTLEVVDLGTFTILQINAVTLIADDVLEGELNNLEQVLGWYVRSRSAEVELLRVLQNPVNPRTLGNQAWLALSALGINASSLAGK